MGEPNGRKKTGRGTEILSAPRRFRRHGGKQE
jgi:hypothetical protein